MQVATSLPRSASFSNFHDENIVTSASLSLYHGESAQCTITLTNTSQIPIEMLEVTMSSALDATLQDEIFFVDPEKVRSLLPLMPEQTCSFDVRQVQSSGNIRLGFNANRYRIHASANFLAPTSAVSPSIPPDLNSGMFSSISNSLPTSSFVRLTNSRSVIVTTVKL